MSCNEWSCPLQYRFEATVLYSNLVQMTCSCCKQTHGDGNCLKWGSCDCSHYITGFQHPVGACGMETNEHYGIGQLTTIFVQKYSRNCSFPTTLKDNIAYVGAIFLVLAGLSFIALGIDIWKFNKTNQCK